MFVPLVTLRRFVLACVLLVGAGAPVAAQLVDIPPFTALDGTTDLHFGNYRVAAGGDSSALVVTGVWTRDIGKSTTIAQRVSSSGQPTGGLVYLDGDIYASVEEVYPDSRGGFVALWDRSIGNALIARLLGSAGNTTTPPLVISQSFAFSRFVAGLPSGFVVVWSQPGAIRVKMFDVAGQPAGPPAIFIPAQYAAALSVARLGSGGFVVVWEEADGTRAQIFDAGGAFVGGAIALTDIFDLNVVAPNPLGGFAIIGRRRFDTHALPMGIWAQRFDDSGAALAPAFVVDFLEPNSLVFPEAAYDPSGRLYVAWQSLSSIVPPLGRAYDPAGRPLHAPFVLNDDPMSALQLAARPDGRFFEGWRENRDFKMQVRALCVPPFHTGCGDGVLSAPCEKCDSGPGNSDTTPDACRTTCALPSCGDGVVDHNEQCDDGNLVGCDGCDAGCNLEPGYVCGDGTVSSDCEEQCDDGPGNDDTLPNACRTDCRHAHCGDGVLDDGESCDDGNRASCDGCSDLCVPEPGLVCGDGIPELLCGEQCDDGNTIDGDGCTEPCRLERIPGGGSPVTDCHSEWVIDNPTNVPLYDKYGKINGTQACVDGDPRCDFDGDVGTCTFHLRVCADNTDLSSCAPESRLQSWQLRAPSAAKAAKHPALAAVRAAFDNVPGAIVGPALPDVCTAPLDVPVSVKWNASGKKAGALVLKAYATLYTGAKDSDKIKLICLP